MDKEQLEARANELRDALQKATEQQLMLRGALAEIQRQLALNGNSDKTSKS